ALDLLEARRLLALRRPRFADETPRGSERARPRRPARATRARALAPERDDVRRAHALAFARCASHSPLELHFEAPGTRAWSALADPAAGREVSAEGAVFLKSHDLMQCVIPAVNVDEAVAALRAQVDLLGRTIQRQTGKC